MSGNAKNYTTITASEFVKFLDDLSAESAITLSGFASQIQQSEPPIDLATRLPEAG